MSEERAGAESRAGLWGTREWALLALAMGAIGFSCTPNFVRLSEVGPIATGFWRALFALPLMALALRWQNRGEAPRARLTSNDYGWLLFTSLAMAADLIFFQSSVHYTTIANAALIGGLHPIVVTFGAAAFLGERITTRFMLGLGLALGGAVLFLRAGGDSFGAITFGDGLAACSAFSFAFYTIGLKKLRGRFPTWRIMVWNMGVSAVVLLPMAALFGEAIVPLSWRGWALLIGFALFVDLLARSSYTYSLQRLPASFNAVALLSFPPLAATIAWVLFGETVGALQAAAAMVVLAGIAIAQRAQR